MEYDAEACRKKWAEAAKVHGFTMATLVFLANQYDPDWRELIPQQRARLEPNAGTKPDADAFELFDPWQPFVVPRFPLDVLPPAVRNFVMAQSAVIGTDVAGMAMSALEVMSAAIDARTRLKMMRHGDWEALARLWVLLVGSPSVKKTPGMGAATDPLVKHANGLLKPVSAGELGRNQIGEP